ncbi:MAG: hypothetical protein M0011_09565 [Elusimicrobia bacterium]|nr:hypothetical protein [Elusimicrobiota bacterium]
MTRNAIRLILLLLLAACAPQARAAKMVPVDVVMMKGELYFVLEEPCPIEFVRLSEAQKDKKPGPRKVKALWLLGFDMSAPVKDRKPPVLSQIKYARKYPEFTRVEGPKRLKRNVEYLVEINSGDKMARATFYISSETKAVVPEPAFERQKGRVYTLKEEKDGTKTLVLEEKEKPEKQEK